MPTYLQRVNADEPAGKLPYFKKNNSSIFFIPINYPFP